MNGNEKKLSSGSWYKGHPVARLSSVQFNLKFENICITSCIYIILGVYSSFQLDILPNLHFLKLDFLSQICNAPFSLDFLTKRGKEENISSYFPLFHVIFSFPPPPREGGIGNFIHPCANTYIHYKQKGFSLLLYTFVQYKTTIKWVYSLICH